MAQRLRDERERRWREPFRQIGRRGWPAKRRVELIDLALVELMYLTELRAQRRVAFELFAERIELERLHEVVHHAAMQRRPKRLDVTRGGDRDDVHRRPAGLMQVAQHLETRAVGQIDVEEHEIRPLSLGDDERLVRGVRDTNDGERPEALEKATMDVRDAEVVVNDERPDAR